MGELTVSEDAGLIFHPGEKITQRNLDLEKENDRLRRGRSRASFFGIMATVALFATLFAGFAGYSWASSQIEQAKSDAQVQIAEAKGETEKARGELELEKADLERIRRQVNELDSYRLLASREIEIAQQQEKLKNHRDFYKGTEALAGLDREKTLDFKPKAWKWDETVQPANWTTAVMTQLDKDKQEYDEVLDEIEDWIVRRAKPRPPTKPCTRSNPFENNPNQNC